MAKAVVSRTGTVKPPIFGIMASPDRTPLFPLSEVAKLIHATPDAVLKAIPGSYTVSARLIGSQGEPVRNTLLTTRGLEAALKTASHAIRQKAIDVVRDRVMPNLQLHGYAIDVTPGGVLAPTTPVEPLPPALDSDLGDQEVLTAISTTIHELTINLPPWAMTTASEFLTASLRYFGVGDIRRLGASDIPAITSHLKHEAKRIQRLIKDPLWSSRIRPTAADTAVAEGLAQAQARSVKADTDKALPASAPPTPLHQPDPAPAVARHYQSYQAALQGRIGWMKTGHLAKRLKLPSSQVLDRVRELKIIGVQDCLDAAIVVTYDRDVSTSGPGWGYLFHPSVLSALTRLIAQKPQKPQPATATPDLFNIARQPRRSHRPGAPAAAH